MPTIKFVLFSHIVDSLVDCHSDLANINLILQVTESDAVDVVESVLHDPGVSETTIAFSLTALLKLTSRFPQCSQ